MIGEKEISIADIVAAIGRRKGIIVGCTAVFSVLGLIYAVLAAPVYTATTVVVPADTEDGGLSPLLGSLSPAAALAGISLGGAGSSRQTYLAIFRSRELADKFIEQHNLLPELFPELWDGSSRTWKENEPGILGRAARAIASLAPAEAKRRTGGSGPTPGAAYREFDKIRSIEEDLGSGTIRISFRFRDPERAAQWTNDYVALANREIRLRTVAESSEALDYLNERVVSTSIVGLRETMYRLVETHLEKITLANARQEFAFRVIDKAVPPEQRSHPRRKMIVVLSLVIGVFFGLLVTVVKEFYMRGSGQSAGSD